jgi:hypothetical protein
MPDAVTQVRNLRLANDEQVRRSRLLLPTKPALSGGRFDPWLTAPLDD